MSVDLNRQYRTSSTKPAVNRLVLNSEFTKLVLRLGMTTPEQFLELPGEVVSGHRDRHVIETRLGALRCFLKKEHRVSSITRIRNWWHGFGRVSLSEREAHTLEHLREAGVPVPECIAYGQAADGRSFLVLKRVHRSISLADALQPGRLTDFERWQMARQLGSATARIHRAGFDAPDLSMKHVLVRTTNRSVVLLDWPSAKRIGTLDRNRSLYALAALHASVDSSLASPRERMLVLRTFLRTLGFHCATAPIAREVNKIAIPLGRRRSISEQRTTKCVNSQRLRWVGGERLCITRPLWRTWAGNIPGWLRDAADKHSPWRTVDKVALGALGHGWLIQLPRAPRWRRWLFAINRQPVTSRAIVESGLAFRMKRMGLPVCSVLAFGARPDGSGFVLTRSPRSCRGLREWLALPRPSRNKIIRHVGRLLNRCHSAGCRGVSAQSLVVTENDNHVPKVRLVPVGLFQRCRRPSVRQVAQDLQTLARELCLFDRRDVIRLVRGYMKNQPVEQADLRLAGAVLSSHRGGRR